MEATLLDCTIWKTSPIPMKCYLVHLYIRVTIWNYTRKQTKLRVNKKGSLDFFAPMHDEYLFLFPFFFEFWLCCGTLRIWGNTESTAMLLVNINAHAQASAESLPAELSRVDFHLNLSYPKICSRFFFFARRVLQRTEQNFVLASSRLPQYYRLALLSHNTNIIIFIRFESISRSIYLFF